MRSRPSIRSAVSNTLVIGKSDAESEPLIRMYRSAITALNVQPDGSDTFRHKGLDDGRRNDLGITSTTVMRMYEDVTHTCDTLVARDHVDAGDRDYLAAGTNAAKTTAVQLEGRERYPAAITHRV